MAATRPTLRTLSKLAANTTQRRALRMTAPAPSPSPLLTTSQKAVNIAQELEDASKRPSIAESKPAAPTTTRHFNTSRSLKTVGDSSTIDFAYLPDFDPDAGTEPPMMRVPLLPHLNKTVAYAGEVDEIVMRPEISLVAADGTHVATPSTFTEVHDNNAVDIDFGSMAGRIAAATKNAGAAVEEQQGLLKQVWSGLVDDIFGSKPQKA